MVQGGEAVTVYRCACGGYTLADAQATLRKHLGHGLARAIWPPWWVRVLIGLGWRP